MGFKLAFRGLTPYILFSNSKWYGKTNQTHRLHKYYFSHCMPQNRRNITGLILLILQSSVIQQFISNYSAILQQSLSSSDPQDFPTILGKCNTLLSRSFSGLHREFYDSLYCGTGWVIELGKPGVFNCSAVKTWFVSVVEFCITYCWWRSICVTYCCVVVFWVNNCWCRSDLCHLLLVSCSVSHISTLQ